MSAKFLKLSIIGAAATLLFSCEEQPVGIDFGDVLISDTTYTAAVEAPQTKNYYVEEFSGVQCTNCPNGAEKLEQLSAANPGRLNIVTIHAGALTAPKYELGSKQDFRSEQGMQIINLIYGGEPAKPSASFDRMPVSPTASNPLTGNLSQWDGMLTSVKSQNSTTPVNIEITTSEESNNTYYINLKVAYTQSVTAPQFLSIYFVEDSIVDNQIYPFIEDYTFRHVFRQSLLAVNGTEILKDYSTKSAGLVYKAKFRLVVDPADESKFKQKYWNMKKMHVVALVHNASSAADKRVLQSVSKHL